MKLYLLIVHFTFSVFALILFFISKDLIFLLGSIVYFALSVGIYYESKVAFWIILLFSCFVFLSLVTSVFEFNLNFEDLIVFVSQALHVACIYPAWKLIKGHPKRRLES